MKNKDFKKMLALFPVEDSTVYSYSHEHKDHHENSHKISNGEHTLSFINYYTCYSSASIDFNSDYKFNFVDFNEVLSCFQKYRVRRHVFCIERRNEKRIRDRKRRERVSHFQRSTYGK